MAFLDNIKGKMDDLFGGSDDDFSGSDAPEHDYVELSGEAAREAWAEPDAS